MPTPPREQSSSGSLPRFGALFGTGRSGTTWLGAIINSHPGVAYRFEPFHRAGADTELRRIRGRIESREFEEADLIRVYQLLLRADALCDKPPFFRKDYHLNLGRLPLWLAARKLPMADRVYARLFHPRGEPPLIFKEVNLESMMNALVEEARIKVVYLVRHPCGTIASGLKGQSEQLMPEGRFGVLDNLMEKHDPELAARYIPQLATLSPAQKNALLWRMDVEKAMRTALHDPTVLTIVYEDLCRDPNECARRIFSHFGLDFPPEAEEFIRLSVTKKSPRTRFETFITNDYFSVYRDPRESMMKWQNQLTEAQKREIEEIIEPSLAYQALAERGSWVPITATASSL